MSDSLVKHLDRGDPSYTLEVRRIADPALGADFTFTVPGSEIWRPVALRFNYTSSAVVANRVPRVNVTDQTTTVATMLPAAVIAASVSASMNFLAGYSTFGPTLITGTQDAPLMDLVLQPGWTIGTSTFLRDAGDQIAGVSLWIERLDLPPWRNPMIGTAYDDAVQHELMQQLQGG